MEGAGKHVGDKVFSSDKVQGSGSRVQNLGLRSYRGTSLIRNNLLLGTCSRTTPGVLWWSLERGVSFERGTPVGRRVPGSTRRRGVLKRQGPGLGDKGVELLHRCISLIRNSSTPLGPP